ncbi:hypothetical protein I3843_03G081700 [Carya illinoinensis]|uniref:Uncharacterized protein n=1 Tax=Carya illinoinensis TaxID=32201 RepID=A0A922FE78_CARIL|nr:hypothetical protein I3760_03G079000 [Carya illinoinensis]KAG6720826.1 hypothetical protein I3842_03G081700 [Carya illinoinensis]KAG7986463.1 hypothetical protein I3843_03G081700 [Carya illinoinensis]
MTQCSSSPKKFPLQGLASHSTEIRDTEMVGGTAKFGQFPALTLVMLLLIMFLQNTSHCGEAIAHASTLESNNGTYLNYHGPMAMDEPELLMFDSQISRTLADYQSSVQRANDEPKNPVFADCTKSCLGKNKYDVPGREKCDGNSFKRNCP